MRAVELLVVVVALVSLSSCDAGSGTPIPEELARAAALRLPGPIRPVHAPELALEGRWIANWIPERDSTQLWVEELGPEGLCRVWVERQPEQGFAFRYDTLAEWRDGALWLHGTDAHTHGEALYPARVDGRECLVPSDSLARVQSAELWSAEEEHAFQRVPELHPSRPLVEGPSVVEPLPAGIWQLAADGEPGEELAWLEVTPTGLPASLRVCLRQRTDAELPYNSFGRASFASRVLTCEPPILGEARWRLFLSGEEAWLAPETGESTEAEAEPAGLHFRLVSRTTRTWGPKLRGLLDTPWNPVY